MKRAMALLLCLALVALGQPPGTRPADKDKPKERAFKNDLEAIQGEWKVARLAGKFAVEKRKDEMELARFHFVKDELSIVGSTGKEPAARFVLKEPKEEKDAKKNKEPGQIDVILPGGKTKLLGAYRFADDDNTLILWLARPGAERPRGVPETLAEFRKATQTEKESATWIKLENVTRPKKKEEKKDGAEKKE